jgi:hypothetical protein
MSDKVTKPSVDELLQAYEVAALAFNSACAPMIFHLLAKSLPNDEQIATEEVARAAVIATRGELWAAYGKRREERTG